MLVMNFKWNVNDNTTQGIRIRENDSNDFINGTPTLIYGNDLTEKQYIHYNSSVIKEQNNYYQLESFNPNGNLKSDTISVTFNDLTYYIEYNDVLYLCNSDGDIIQQSPGFANVSTPFAINHLGDIIYSRFNILYIQDVQGNIKLSKNPYANEVMITPVMCDQSNGTIYYNTRNTSTNQRFFISLNADGSERFKWSITTNEICKFSNGFIIKESSATTYTVYNSNTLDVLYSFSNSKRTSDDRINFNAQHIPMDISIDGSVIMTRGIRDLRIYDNTGNILYESNSSAYDYDTVIKTDDMGVLLISDNSLLKFSADYMVQWGKPFAGGMHYGNYIQDTSGFIWLPGGYLIDPMTGDTLHQFIIDGLSASHMGLGNYILQPTYSTQIDTETATNSVTGGNVITVSHINPESSTSLLKSLDVIDVNDENSYTSIPVPNNKTVYIDYDVQQGVTYHYIIRCVDDQGNIFDSSPFQYTVP